MRAWVYSHCFANSLRRKFHGLVKLVLVVLVVWRCSSLFVPEITDRWTIIEVGGRLKRVEILNDWDVGSIIRYKKTTGRLCMS